MYALSCAFGFLFSLIPIIIMIAAVLTRFLHTSPELLYGFLENAKKWIDTANLHAMANYLLAQRRPTLFEVIIGITIFFFARRFFYTVMQSVRRIFHGPIDPRPLLAQLIAVAGEVLLVVIAAAAVFIISAAKPFFYTIARSTENFAFFLPFIGSGFAKMLPLLFNTVPYLLIWIFAALTFRFASGTKPEFKTCAFSALLCALIFALVGYVFTLFTDTVKYNLIYGFLGTLMVMLLKVSIFFSLFLFFAQYVYVSQFFDSLLLAELYLLPDRGETDIFLGIRRMLFIRPDRFLKAAAQGESCERNGDRPVLEKKKAGSLIFSKGDTDTDVYYLAQGSVELLRENNIAYLDRGSFFGELNVLLNEPRNATARAATDIQLIKISERRFTELLNSSPEAVRKTLSLISSYFARNINLTENVGL